MVSPIQTSAAYLHSGAHIHVHTQYICTHSMCAHMWTCLHIPCQKVNQRVCLSGRFVLKGIFSGQEMNPVFRKFQTTLAFPRMRTARKARFPGKDSQDNREEKAGSQWTPCPMLVATAKAAQFFLQ